MALWGIGLGWRWLALLLDLAGWIVYLVSLSVLQHRCNLSITDNTNTYGETGGTFNPAALASGAGNNAAWSGTGPSTLTATNQLIGTSDYFDTPRRCRYLYSFPWYLFAFQFFLVVLYAIMHTMKRTYGLSRGPLAALTAYGLYLATKVTDIFFHIRYSAWGAQGNHNGPVKAVFAGALIMAVAKGLLLLGLLFPHEEHDEGVRKVTKVEATTYAAPPRATETVAAVPPAGPAHV